MPHGCGLLEALQVRPMGLQGRALASLRRSARNRDHIPQWGRGGGTVYTVVSHSAFPATPCEYEYTTQSLLTSHFSLSLCFSTLVYRVKFIFRCFSWMETLCYHSMVSLQRTRRTHPGRSIRVHKRASGSRARQTIRRSRERETDIERSRQ